MPLFLVLFFITCGPTNKTNVYRKGTLATAAPIATDIGLKVFEQGGNAFDVAIAVAFALQVVHPEAGNIGGGGFALIRLGSTGEVKALDFREVAPKAATSTMYLDSAGNVIDGLSTLGAKAVGVPGTVAGLYELWKQCGSVDWKTLVSISANLADSGFILDEYQANSFKKYEEDLSAFEETAILYSLQKKSLASGDRLIQPELALALSQIAAAGPQAFYSGDIADSLVATVQRYGGIITLEDLANYSIKWREPIHFQFDSLDIYSMPPPSSGGIVMGQILKTLHRFDFRNFTPDSIKYIHLFCEAARLAYADRSLHLGDPDFYDIPKYLLNDNYLSQRAKLIDLNHANTSQDIQPGTFASPESKQTTHFSVADNKGNLVAITYTLNDSYGSKLSVRGCGFLLNNEMDDFAIAPGHANLYGLVGGEANKVQPGKRMLSSMSPTIILKQNKPFLILGSPGGSEIITAVAQCILNFTRFHRSLEESVAHPRFHHQWLPDEIKLEQSAYGIDIKQGLIRMGHNVKEFKPATNIQMIYVDDSGRIAAASDPRGRGKAGGF